MLNAPADSPAPLHVPAESPRLRVALVVDDDREPSALATTLAAGGLPPNAGVLPLGRVDELPTDPPVAIVIAADVSRPKGLSALRSLRRRAPDARIVVVTRDATRHAATKTLNEGADALILEQDSANALPPAVRAVVAGLVCAPRAARRLVAKPTFSHREKEVLELLVAGMTNRQIAGRLYLAESTVKSHVASAFAKLGVRSRKDAAAILLDPAEGLAATALPRAAALRAGGYSGQAAARPVLAAPTTSR
jgi:DNA-binding NarL/FixJ family response regulator